MVSWDAQVNSRDPCPLRQGVRLGRDPCPLFHACALHAEPVAPERIDDTMRRSDPDRSAHPAWGGLEATSYTTNGSGAQLPRDRPGRRRIGGSWADLSPPGRRRVVLSAAAHDGREAVTYGHCRWAGHADIRCLQPWPNSHRQMAHGALGRRTGPSPSRPPSAAFPRGRCRWRAKHAILVASRSRQPDDRAARMMGHVAVTRDGAAAAGRASAGSPRAPRADP